MNFKIGDTIEALEDAFIERDSFTNTLIYSKGTKGKILYICKNDLIVKFDSGYGDCKWCIPKEKVKLVSEEKEMNFVEEVKETYNNFLKEKWSKFAKEDIIINCKSKLDFEDFINFVSKNFDLDYSEYEGAFKKYSDKLCFEYNKQYNDLHYWDIKSYKNETEYKDYKIITWTNFIKNSEVKNVEKAYQNNLKKKWNKFKSENIIINCESELDFENFINFACKNSKIDYEDYKRCFEYYNNKLCFSFEDGTLYYSPKKYYVGEKEYCDFKILTWNEFIKNDEVDIMKKTFEDLVLDIKDGEVWSSDAKLVEDTNGNIVVRYKDGCKKDFMVFSKNEIFEKVRKEYDYIEAYTAYLKEGKEIESIYSGINYKRMDGKDFYIEDYKDEWRECSGIDFCEMNGKWYINN